jgi:hypothetical protein
MHAPSPAANITFDRQEFNTRCATDSARPNACGFLAGPLAPPSAPLFSKRTPFDVNQGLSPLQTALNGNPAMSDFQRLLPLQTASNGNPAMSDFQTANSVILGPERQ